jgi:hypothetical protein
MLGRLSAYGCYRGASGRGDFANRAVCKEAMTGLRLQHFTHITVFARRLYPNCTNIDS